MKYLLAYGMAVYPGPYTGEPDVNLIKPWGLVMMPFSAKMTENYEIAGITRVLYAGYMQKYQEVGGTVAEFTDWDFAEKALSAFIGAHLASTKYA